ncbi:hypothetical protein OHS32_03865 [Micromonospora chokoriensis]
MVRSSITAPLTELLGRHVAARAGKAVSVEHERPGPVLVEVDQPHPFGREVVQEAAVVEVDSDEPGGADGEMGVEDRVERRLYLRHWQLLESGQPSAVSTVRCGVVQDVAVVPGVDERRASRPVGRLHWTDDHRVTDRGVHRACAV